MATGMFGADTDALRAVGRAFDRHGSSVESIGFDVRSEIGNVEWFGADATAFRSNWGDKLHLDLTGLGRRLEDVQRHLQAQADDQDDASESGSDEGCLKSTWDGVTDWFGSLGAAIWGDLEGIGLLLGIDENGWSWNTLQETWTGMGVLVGYNPGDGTWGNWGLAGSAWTMFGKEILAWDSWGHDNNHASATSAWNVGSTFIPFGAIGKAGKIGKAAGLADDAATVAKALDGSAATAARGTDEAAALAKGSDDAAAAARKTPEGTWNTVSGYSPDVPVSTRTTGANPHKMSLHNGPYDTGAWVDPITGNIQSTSGRTFDSTQVSHHYTTSTGSGDRALKVSKEPGTTPFTPDHRFVLDDGKTVVETDSLGRPDYTRYTMDGRAIKVGGGPTDFSAEPWRSGQQSKGSGWPDPLYHLGDQRGHASPAQHRGPNEDLNTVPQSKRANGIQADVEMAISDYYYSDANAGQPLIVERRVTYGDDGHASHYDFTVTDANGKPVNLDVPTSFRD